MLGLRDCNLVPRHTDFGRPRLGDIDAWEPVAICQNHCGGVLGWPSECGSNKVLVAAAERVGRHRPLAGQLDLVQDQRAFPRGHGDAPVGQGKDVAGRRFPVPPGKRFAAQDLERLAAVGRVRARPGIVRADRALDVDGGLTGSDASDSGSTKTSSMGNSSWIF